MPPRLQDYRAFANTPALTPTEERYPAYRTAAPRMQGLNTTLAGLPVTVVQGTSDEARALRRHIEKDRAAQHVSDLFHGQQEV